MSIGTGCGSDFLDVCLSVCLKARGVRAPAGGRGAPPSRGLTGIKAARRQHRAPGRGELPLKVRSANQEAKHRRPLRQLHLIGLLSRGHFRDGVDLGVRREGAFSWARVAVFLPWCLCLPSLFFCVSCSLVPSCLFQLCFLKLCSASVPHYSSLFCFLAVCTFCVLLLLSTFLTSLLCFWLVLLLWWCCSLCSLLFILPIPASINTLLSLPYCLFFILFYRSLIALSLFLLSATSNGSLPLANATMSPQIITCRPPKWQLNPRKWQCCSRK